MQCLFFINIFCCILEIHTNCHLCENLLTQKKKWLELENRISKYTPCQEIIINWPIILLRLVLAHQSNDYQNIYPISTMCIKIPSRHQWLHKCARAWSFFFAYLLHYLNESTYFVYMCVCGKWLVFVKQHFPFFSRNN